MPQVLVTQSHLEDIADAIREKNGEETLYKPSDMAAAVLAIPQGSTPVLEQLSVTENGTYTPEEGVDGFDEVVVSVSGGGGSTLIEKIVTQNGVYEASQDSADGYSKVTVNVPVPSEKTELIPVMTSDTTPSGVASASSVFISDFSAYRAFDGINTTSSMNGGWLASSSDYAPYLQYEFASASKCDSMTIYTANNSTTATRTVTIQGRKNNTWENCLKTGSTVTLNFQYGTYGSSCIKHDIELNGETYDAIKITGNEPFYMGTGRTACTFDSVQVYTETIVNSVLLLTQSEWNALSTAQKREYGLVAIQKALSGFIRGDLINGADYVISYPGDYVPKHSWNVSNNQNHEYVFEATTPTNNETIYCLAAMSQNGTAPAFGTNLDIIQADDVSNNYAVVYGEYTNGAYASTYSRGDNWNNSEIVCFCLSGDANPVVKELFYEKGQTGTYTYTYQATGDEKLLLIAMRGGEYGGSYTITGLTQKSHVTSTGARFNDVYFGAVENGDEVSISIPYASGNGNGSLFVVLLSVEAEDE